jgi:hypothetical protein
VIGFKPAKAFLILLPANGFIIGYIKESINILIKEKIKEKIK